MTNMKDLLASCILSCIEYLLNSKKKFVRAEDIFFVILLTCCSHSQGQGDMATKKTIQQQLAEGIQLVYTNSIVKKN